MQFVETNMSTQIPMEEIGSSPKSIEDYHLENLPDQLIRGEYLISCNFNENCSPGCFERNVSTK